MAISLRTRAPLFSAASKGQAARKTASAAQKPVLQAPVEIEKPITAIPEPTPEPKPRPSHPHGGFLIRPKIDGEPTVVDFNHLTPWQRRSLQLFQILIPEKLPDPTPEERASLKAFRIAPREDATLPTPLPQDPGLFA